MVQTVGWIAYSEAGNDSDDCDFDGEALLAIIC